MSRFATLDSIKKVGEKKEAPRIQGGSSAGGDEGEGEEGNDYYVGGTDGRGGGSGLSVIGPPGGEGGRGGSSDLYKRIFERARKKKKKKKKRKREGEGEGREGSSSSKRREGEEEGGVKGEEENEEGLLQAKAGTGRITSSGQIVTGYDTKFLSELKVNDALIITHPSTFMEETRIVKMIVSNSGMSLSSGFSTDLISTTSFKYIHPPTDEVEEDPEEAKKKKAVGEEASAFGTYASGGGNQLVYRVKKAGTYGGYKIVKEDVGSLSRTELLERRLQHKSDRHAN